MTVVLQHDEDRQILEVALSGKLTAGDYDVFVPQIERLIEKHGQLRLLVGLFKFRGWTAGALWEDIKFDVRHFRDVERLAIVGEKKWHKGMARFCRPFTAAKIKYFDQPQISAAREWLTEQSRLVSVD